MTLYIKYVRVFISRSTQFLAHFREKETIMATKVDIAQTNISAAQVSEMFRLAAIPGSHVNGSTLQKFIEGRNPFDAPKDTRIEFTVTGTGLTAAAWISTLESAGHKFGDRVRNVLSRPDYDAKHRLEAGKVYKVVLVRGTEITRDHDRTTKNLKAIAVNEFGERSVSGLKGELALLIRMKFSNAELEQMGLWYIAVLHDPIVDSDTCSIVLNSNRSYCESWVGTGYGGSDGSWGGGVAFAFLTGE